MRDPANLGRFDLNLLVVLDVLLEERNVTRAAQRLHLSQSATSGALQRLRDQFNDPLLERAGRELALTALARTLIEPVRAAITSVRAVVDAEAAFDPRSARRVFRIAMSDYCMMVLLPRVMDRLSESAPRIRIQIEPINREIFAALEKGTLDLCVTTDDWRVFGQDRDRDAMKQQLLFSDTFVCALGERYGGSAISLEQFASAPHAMVKFGDFLTSIEEETLRRLDIEVNVVATVPSFSALAFVIAHTGAVAVMQRRLAETLAQSLPITTAPVPFEVPELREAMAWHERNDRDPAHTWLRSLLTEVTASMT